MEIRSIPWAIRLAGVALLLIALCGLHPACPFRASAPPVPPIPALQPFAKQPATLDLGVQPYWFPTNLIAEVLRRDAELTGELAALGFKIAFHPYFKGAEITSLLQEGLLDGGFLGRMPALMACASGEVRMLALSSLDQASLVSRTPLPLTHLSGHRIGATASSIGHFILLDLTRQVRAEQVEMVPMELFEMPGALWEKRVDAVVAWEPMAAHLLHRGGHLVYQGAGEGYFALSRRMTAERPQAAEAILAAYLRALRALDGEETLARAIRWSRVAQRDLTGPELDLPEGVLAAMARESVARIRIPRFSAHDRDSDGAIHRAWQFLQSEGRISPEKYWEMTGRACFDNAPLDRVLDRPDAWLEGVRRWTGETP